MKDWIRGFLAGWNGRPFPGLPRGSWSRAETRWWRGNLAARRLKFRLYMRRVGR